MNKKGRLERLETKLVPPAPAEKVVVRVDWGTEEREPEPGEVFIDWTDIGEDEELEGEE